MESDGNFVMYSRSSTSNEWSFAGFAAGTSGNHVELQNDGELVVFNTLEEIQWTSNSTAGTAPFRLIVSDDIAAYILDSSNVVVWSTNPSFSTLETIWYETFDSDNGLWTFSNDATLPSPSTNCPYYPDECLKVLSDGNNAYVTRSTVISMYSAIQFQVDVGGNGLETTNGDYCEIWWQFDDGSWIQYNTVYENEIYRDVIIDIPLPTSYTSINIALETQGSIDSTNDACYFDNAILRGTYGTIWSDVMDNNNNGDWTVVNQVTFGSYTQCADGSCAFSTAVNGYSIINRITDVSDYIDISLKVDLFADGLEDTGAYCRISWRYDDEPFADNVNDYTTDGTYNDQVIAITDPGNHTMLTTRVLIVGVNGSESCYWDNVILRGTLVNQNPTNQLTISPTKQPTEHPIVGTIWHDTMDYNGYWIVTKQVSFGNYTQCSDGSCAFTALVNSDPGNSSIQRDTDVSDYIDITLTVDLVVEDIEDHEGDICQISWRYDDEAFTDNKYDYTTDGTYNDQVIAISDPLGRSILSVRLLNIGDNPTDSCYWDNVILRGTYGPTGVPSTVTIPPTVFGIIWYDVMDNNNNGDWVVKNKVTFGSYTQCPDGSCAFSRADGAASRIDRATNVSGYIDISLKVDLVAEGLGGDICRISWRYDDESFSDNQNDYTTDGTYNDQVIAITDPGNRTILTMRCLSVGANANESCYWDNIILRGTLVNQNPTHSTISPTKLPTEHPIPSATQSPIKELTTSTANTPSDQLTLSPTKPTASATVMSTQLATSDLIILSIHTTESIKTTASSSTKNITPKSTFQDDRSSKLLWNGILSSQWFLMSLILFGVLVLAFLTFFIYHQRQRTATKQNINNDEDNVNSNYDAALFDWFEHTVELPEYLDNFIQNGYQNMMMIQQIENKSQLNEIGIVMKGHQTLIMSEIDKLHEVHDKDNKIDEIRIKMKYEIHHNLNAMSVDSVWRENEKGLDPKTIMVDIEAKNNETNIGDVQWANRAIVHYVECQSESEPNSEHNDETIINATIEGMKHDEIATKKPEHNSNEHNETSDETNKDQSDSNAAVTIGAMKNDKIFLGIISTKKDENSMQKKNEHDIESIQTITDAMKNDKIALGVISTRTESTVMEDDSEACLDKEDHDGSKDDSNVCHDD